MCLCLERYNICKWVYNFFYNPIVNRTPHITLDEERDIVLYYDALNDQLNDNT